MKKYGLYYAILVTLFFIFIGFIVKKSTEDIHFLNWDEGWFFKIVDQGYIFNGDYQEQQNVAFYPMYPFLCTIIPIISKHASMLIISAICNLVSVYFLYILVSRVQKNNKIALFTIILFSSSPFYFYMYSRYSESTFIMFILAFLYFLIVKGNNLIALICISLASLTRMNGVFLLAIYFLHNFQLVDKKRLFLDLFMMPIGLLGWLSFSLYFYYKFNDPLLMINIYKAWGNAPGFSFVNLLKLNGLLKDAFVISLDNPRSIGAITLIIIIAFLPNVYQNLNKTIFYYTILFTCFFILIYSETIISLGRYLLMLFPFYWILALKLSDNSTDSITFKDIKVFIIAILTFSINVYYHELFLKGKIFVG